MFDRDSYYYLKNQVKQEISKSYNISYNTVEIDKEFGAQADFFLNNSSLGNFLNKKEMLTSYKGGSILKQLSSKIEKLETSTSEWF
jgi:hypothetical protein